MKERAPCQHSDVEIQDLFPSPLLLKQPPLLLSFTTPQWLHNAWSSSRTVSTSEEQEETLFFQKVKVIIMQDRGEHVLFQLFNIVPFIPRVIVLLFLNSHNLTCAGELCSRTLEWSQCGSMLKPEIWPAGGNSSGCKVNKSDYIEVYWENDPILLTSQ